MAILDSIAIEFDLEKLSFKQIPLDEIHIDKQDTTKIYWIHCDLNQHDIFTMLTKKLTLPEDVVSLCTHEEHIPKLIDTDETLTIQIQCLQSPELTKGKQPTYANLILHLTNQICFSATSQQTQVLSEFIRSFPKAIRYAKTPCFILFLLLDNIVNDYARILFNFELLAEQMDLRVHQSHHNVYHKVMRVKQQVMKAKRYTIAVREILMRISGRKISVISEQCRISLDNLANHTHMVVHESDSIRDILNGLLDQIENGLMQKMNETMKVLTAFAAIFLPMTLITSIYGMNFQWMPELNWKYGYFYALSLVLVCGLILLYLFKKKKWF